MKSFFTNLNIVNLGVITVNDFTCASAAPVPWRSEKLPVAEDRLWPGSA